MSKLNARSLLNSAFAFWILFAKGKIWLNGALRKNEFRGDSFPGRESGRSRSIDQVIRRISGMLPEEVKKKDLIQQAT